MSDDIPTSLEPILLDLKAEVELLRYVVSFLCAATVPRDALDRLIEALQTPVAAESPEATKVMYKAIDRFVDKLEKGRPRPED